MNTKYPEITIPLVGEDGNAFAILAKVRKAMKKAGIPVAEQEEFFAEAMGGDYDNLLQTVMKWFEVK